MSSVSGRGAIASARRFWPDRLSFCGRGKSCLATSPLSQSMGGVGCWGVASTVAEWLHIVGRALLFGSVVGLVAGEKCRIVGRAFLASAAVIDRSCGSGGVLYAGAGWLFLRVLGRGLLDLRSSFPDLLVP